MGFLGVKGILWAVGGLGLIVMAWRTTSCVATYYENKIIVKNKEAHERRERTRYKKDIELDKDAAKRKNMGNGEFEKSYKKSLGDLR